MKNLFWRYGLIVFVVLLILPAFQALIFTDMILARGDTLVYFYPYRDALHEALRAGTLPLWTNDIFMGVPLLANPQLGTYYPLNWLTVFFSAPDAIRIQVILHVMLAMAGTFLLYKAIFPEEDNLIPALLAAIVYGAGGHLSAHIEQINQHQGLTWLPWLLFCLHYLGHSRHKIRWMLAITGLFALQLVTGHTQTVFISGVTMGLYLLFSQMTGRDAPAQRLRRVITQTLMLLLTCIGALLLATPQLLPTMELTGLSNRSGGFSVQEATAFSWPPTYIGRSFLPNYDGQLFGEYVAFVGIIALALALWGLLTGRDATRQKWTWFVIALIGVVLAFGRYTPLYLLLAEFPGFNLFRVPARWLVLPALALALLAGYGTQTLIQQKKPDLRFLPGVVIPVTGLILLALFIFPNFMAEATDFTGTPAPDTRTLFIWAATLALICIMIAVRRFAHTRGFSVVLLILVALELVAAAQPMPHNKLAPREVYEGQRFTISQMMALADEQLAPGRMLAISDLLFEVGDKAVQDARFARSGMDAYAVRTAYEAIKWQTIFYPNFPLTWDVPSLDGYGGGLLPMQYYSQFTSLLLPEGAVRSADGRIGEMLMRDECRSACIPAAAWLDMANVQYLITDKVRDITHNGIFYDTALDFTRAEIQLYPPLNAPQFEATHLHMLYTGEEPPALTVRTSDDEYLNLYDIAPALETEMAIQENFNLLMIPVADMPGLLYSAATEDTQTHIHALSAVDRRTGDFVQLTPPGWQKVLSTEIKIYERNPLPRAVLALETFTMPDTWQGGEDALTALAASQDTPGFQAYLHTDEPNTLTTGKNAAWAGSSTEILAYSDTRIEIAVDARADATLVLYDAWYPGWKATIDGEPVDVYRTNVMFRGVQVPAGEHTVIFTFEPELWRNALIIGGAAWLVFALLLIWQWRRR